MATVKLSALALIALASISDTDRLAIVDMDGVPPTTYATTIAQMRTTLTTPSTNGGDVLGTAALQWADVRAQQATLTGLLTIASGGLTVASGTTAVQALTATAGTFSGAVVAEGASITGTLPASTTLALGWDSTGGLIQSFGSKPLNLNSGGNSVNVGGGGLTIAGGGLTVSAGGATLVGTHASGPVITFTTSDNAFTLGFDTSLGIPNQRIYVKDGGGVERMSITATGVVATSFTITGITPAVAGWFTAGNTKGLLVQNTTGANKVAVTLDGSNVWQFGDSLPATFNGGLTVSASGLTVSSGTSALQAVTATNITPSGQVALAASYGGGFAAAAWYRSAALGVVFSAVTGSSFDFYLSDPIGVAVMQVPTGTRNVQFANLVTAAGGVAVTAGGLTVSAGASALQALTATSASIVGAVVPVSFTAGASGTHGATVTQRWFRADGVTLRAFLGFNSNDDQHFDIGTAETGGIVRIVSGNNVAALIVNNDQTLNATAGLTASGVITANAGGKGIAVGGTTTLWTGLGASNTSGSVLVGVLSSTGGGAFGGAGNGYAGFVGTDVNQPLDFFTNSTRRGGFAASGVFDVNAGLTVSAGTSALQALTATTGAFSGGMSTPQGNAVRLTGAAGSEYIYSPSGSVVDIVSGGSALFRVNLNAGSPVTSVLAGSFSVAAGLTVVTGTTALSGGLTVSGPLPGNTISLGWDVTAGGQIQTYSSKPLNLNAGGNPVAVGGGGLTVAAGGLTVSSGTSALQAMTATSGGFTAAVSIGGGLTITSAGLTVSSGPTGMQALTAASLTVTGSTSLAATTVTSLTVTSSLSLPALTLGTSIYYAGTSTAIGATATTIYTRTNSGKFAYLFVHGTAAGGTFYETVVMESGAAFPVVINSTTYSTGTVPLRNYTVSGAAIKLDFGGTTGWTITVTPFEF